MKIAKFKSFLFLISSSFFIFFLSACSIFGINSSGEQSSSLSSFFSDESTYSHIDKPSSSDSEVPQGSNSSLSGEESSSSLGSNSSLSGEESSSSLESNSSETKSSSITVDVFASNDTHGLVSDSGESLGIAKVATYLKEQKVNNENTLILSSGDMWQGTAESSLTYGSLMTEWMNEVGYASMTYGNHEFDWGTSYIAKNDEIANFPFLGINIYDNSTSARWEYASPSLCVNYGELKIGIIGAIGDCYDSISSSLVSGISFKTGNELTSLVKEESTRLRKEGADVIIYSLHDGYSSYASGTLNDSSLSSYYDVSLSEGYVDLVFEAHTHQQTVYMDSNSVYHLQASANHTHLSHAKFTYDFASKSLSVTTAEAVNLESYSSLKEDDDSLAIISKYDDVIGDINKTIGTNSTKRNSTALAKLVASLYLEAGLSKWSDYQIILGGGYIKARSPYNLSKGDITYADLFALFPFNNDIVLVRATGKKINAMSNMNNYHIKESDYASSITIEEDERYYIVTDTYSLDYAANGFIYVDTYQSGVYARDLLKDYASKGGFAS